MLLRQTGLLGGICFRYCAYKADKAGYDKIPQKLMWEMCEGDINKVTGRTAFDAMRKDDEAGKRVVSRYTEFVAIGVSNCINIFQPDILCIGGGISKEGDTLINPIKAYVEGENYARNISKSTEIKTAAPR